jgi:hypothetical protein
MAHRRRNPGNGRGQTVPWRQDPEIIERVGVVGTLYFQPIATALVAVNQWCRDRGLATVTYDTVKTDRERFLETLHEGLRAGGKARIDELEQQRAAVWRDLAAQPAGASRAPLYAEVRHLTMAIARMEGSVPLQGLDPLGAGGTGIRLEDLVSPEELLERGELALTDYKGFLRAVSMQISGPAKRLQLPAPVGEVIEAVAGPQDRQDAPRSPRRAQRRAVEPAAVEPHLDPVRRSGVRVYSPPAP